MRPFEIPHAAGTRAAERRAGIDIRRGWIAAVLVLTASGASGVSSSVASAALPCRVVRSAAPHTVYATLAQAVSASSSNETLAVNGTCEGDTTITVATTPLKIQGTLGATLNGAHKEGSVLTVQPGVTVVASGLTITGGTGTKYPGEVIGGGVLNEGTLTLSNSYVTGNEITEENGFGGGIENFAGTLTLNNSIVSHNSATMSGGGMFDYQKTGVVTLNNSTVSLNTADHGGGILDQEAALTLNNSSVVGNTAKERSGGIAVVREATVLLNSSAVIGNRASYAGGIEVGGPEENFPTGTTVSLKGLSTVLANKASAKEHGGGILIEKGGKLHLGAAAIVSLNTPENIFQEP